MKARCPECGATFNGSDSSGGHCRGGAYGGCCRTFASDSAAAAHRRGPYHPPGARRCVDVTQPDVNSKGKPIIWRLTSRGWTNAKERPWPARA